MQEYQKKKPAGFLKDGELFKRTDGSGGMVWKVITRSKDRKVITAASTTTETSIKVSSNKMIFVKGKS